MKLMAFFKDCVNLVDIIPDKYLSIAICKKMTMSLAITKSNSCRSMIYLQKCTQMNNL